MRIAGWVAVLTVATVGVSGRAEAQTVGCATKMIAGAASGALRMAAEAQADLKADKPDEAFKLFEAAYCLYPDPNLKHGLSYAALAANRCDEAYDDAEQWARRASSEKRAEAKKWLSVVEGQCIPVALRTEPPGATVRLDGSPNDLGTTPWVSHVHAGKHTVTFSKAGYSEVEKEIELLVGARLSPVVVSVRLTRLLGTPPPTEDLPLDLAGPGPAVAAATPPPEAPKAAEPPTSDELPPIETPEEAARSEPVHPAPPPVRPAVVADARPATAPAVAPPHSVVDEPRPATPPESHEAPLTPVVLKATPPAEAPAPRAPPPPWIRPAAWAAIGVGAALLVVATALGATARSEVTTLQTRAQPGETIQARLDGINGLGTGANALFAVGGVVAAAGVGVRVAF